jgi:ribosomal protein L11 methyltransferase
MADQNRWYSISVTVAPEAAEAIEYAFNTLDALGTEINHLRKRNAESVIVVGYFNDLPDDDHFQDELHYALSVYGFTEETATRVERSEIEDADWLAEWKKHWKPSDVGAFVIAPPWSDVAAGDKIVIRIEPNMAFGTGTHETTQLCLRAIDKYYRAGQSFLDVGTGTGILAIAVAKFNLKSEISNSRSGAEISKTEMPGFAPGHSDLKVEISNLKVLACDTDVDSIKIAKENAVLNEVADLIDFEDGSISHETPIFDFVCANLTLDVIEPLLPMLLQKSSSILLLSGILSDQEHQIVSALRSSGLEHHEIERAGEWISVLIDKRSERSESRLQAAAPSV